MNDLVGKIIAFEDGDMSEGEMLDFFQELLDTGMITNLQGSYHRHAKYLLELGLINPPNTVY